jgi:hypothetical protein
MNDETNLNITYTQIASCGVGRPTTEVRRQSLRAKLEREREMRAQRQQHSFVDTLRNLFNLA